MFVDYYRNLLQQSCLVSRVCFLFNRLNGVAINFVPRGSTDFWLFVYLCYQKMINFYVILHYSYHDLRLQYCHTYIKQCQMYVIRKIIYIKNTKQLILYEYVHILLYLNLNLNNCIYSYIQRFFSSFLQIGKSGNVCMSGFEYILCHIQLRQFNGKSLRCFFFFWCFLNNFELFPSLRMIFRRFLMSLAILKIILSGCYFQDTIEVNNGCFIKISKISSVIHQSSNQA